MAWTPLAAAARREPPLRPWRRTPFAAVLGLWALLNLTALLDLGDGGRFPPAQLIAYALAAGGVAALAATGHGLQPPFRYRALREAALGPMAHGVRRG